jgi:hypothetical protein
VTPPLAIIREFEWSAGGKRPLVCEGLGSTSLAEILQKQKDGRRKSSQFVCKLSAAPQLPLPDVQCYLKPENLT